MELLSDEEIQVRLEIIETILKILGCLDVKKVEHEIIPPILIHLEKKNEEAQLRLAQLFHILLDNLLEKKLIQEEHWPIYISFFKVILITSLNHLQTIVFSKDLQIKKFCLKNISEITHILLRENCELNLEEIFITISLDKDLCILELFASQFNHVIFVLN
jgi:hypothetical protein